jgi:hypothetical protein
MVLDLQDAHVWISRLIWFWTFWDLPRDPFIVTRTTISLTHLISYLISPTITSWMIDTHTSTEVRDCAVRTARNYGGK